MNMLRTKKDEIALVPSIELKIYDLEKTIASLKAEQEELKAALKAEMEKRGVIGIDTDALQIRYIGETDVENFDKTRFRKENPDLYDEYITMKQRAAYVTIKVKEEAAK